jgi:polysaccharide biosynthesis protein PslH
MKIIWVKAEGLMPLYVGGTSRSYHILRELARRNEVTLFTYYAEESEDLHAQLRHCFSEVVAIPLVVPQSYTWPDRLARVRNLFSKRPYEIARFYRKPVADRLAQLLTRNMYDALVCDFLHTAPVVPWDACCPKVLFCHNVEAKIWKRQVEVTDNLARKALYWRDYQLMLRAERAYLRQADWVLAVSEEDRSVFARFTDAARTAVIPTGVDSEYFKPDNQPEVRNSLVFTGQMDWLANQDAMLYFVHEILRRIQQRQPDVSLWIVGRNPLARVQQLAAQYPNIHVTGTVEDVRPYIAQSAVYVVPLRVGSGTRLKIFEAMAMGKAIVSTVVGAEGLPVTHNEDILLAQSPEDFAASVLRLLADETARKRLGQAARQLVEQNYSWAKVGLLFESSLVQAVRSTAARRRDCPTPIARP